MLIGKVIIRGTIDVKTGMRIGGTTGGLKIGGVDLNVITDPEGKPYIPGSSLKGKMRSLIEHKEGVSFDPKSGMHVCKTNPCDICKIWGTTGDVASLTRLVVRDAYLDEEDFKTIKEKGNLSLEWTEVKTEVNIDRTTGTVSGVGGPRQIERVPAGAKFKDFEMIYNVYGEEDKDILVKIFEAMELLQQDYLGGMGSRGYGQVEFQDIKIYWNKKENYEGGKLNQEKINDNLTTPEEIVEKFDKIKKKLE